MPVQVGLVAIKPRRSFGRLGQRMVQQLVSQAQASGREIKADFEKTTATWNHQVDFILDVSKSGADLRLKVYTTDEIYKFVNSGTREHPIPKTGTAHLVFQWGGKGSYRPKTRAGVIGSGAGGPTGSIVHRKAVVHPGTQARNFDKAIYDRWLKSGRLKSDLQNAVNSAILGW